MNCKRIPCAPTDEIGCSVESRLVLSARSSACGVWKRADRQGAIKHYVRGVPCYSRQINHLISHSFCKNFQSMVYFYHGSKVTARIRAKTGNKPTIIT